MAHRKEVNQKSAQFCIHPHFCVLGVAVLTCRCFHLLESEADCFWILDRPVVTVEDNPLIKGVCVWLRFSWFCVTLWIEVITPQVPKIGGHHLVCASLLKSEKWCAKTNCFLFCPNGPVYFLSAATYWSEVGSALCWGPTAPCFTLLSSLIKHLKCIFGYSICVQSVFQSR